MHHHLTFVQRLRNNGVPLGRLAEMAGVPATFLEELLEAFRLTQIQIRLMRQMDRLERGAGYHTQKGRGCRPLQ
jgi:hypothetical protein